MKADIKKKWVAALRSGEYQQGKGALAKISDNGQIKYCCLGVLCELSPVAGVRSDDLVKYDDEGGTLPPSVAKWAGLTATNPEVCGHSLSVWNDVMDKSLSEIADIIEAGIRDEEKAK